METPALADLLSCESEPKRVFLPLRPFRDGVLVPVGPTLKSATVGCAKGGGAAVSAMLGGTNRATVNATGTRWVRQALGG